MRVSGETPCLMRKQRSRRAAPSGRGLEEAGLELLTMGAVIHPIARRRHPLASGDCGSMANHGNQLAVTACLHPEDTEAVLRVLERHTIDQPGKYLPIRWFRLRFHHVRRAAEASGQLKAYMPHKSC